MKPIIRVGVPYPNNSGVMKKCRESLQRLADSDLFDTKDNIFEIQGASISVLRNNAVTKGDSKVHQTNLPFDYYLCIDSDIEFQVEDVKKLIDRDKDIISGAYRYRHNHSAAVAGHFKPGLKGLCENDDFICMCKSGLHKVDFVGAGFLLIKKKVLEGVEYPWFMEQVIQRDRDGVPHAYWTGEDIGFCVKAVDAGFEIWADMDVKVNHMLEEAEPLPPMRDKYTPAEAWELFLGSLNRVQAVGQMFYKAIGGKNDSKT